METTGRVEGPPLVAVGEEYDPFQPTDDVDAVASQTDTLLSPQTAQAPPEALASQISLSGEPKAAFSTSFEAHSGTKTGSAVYQNAKAETAVSGAAGTAPLSTEASATPKEGEPKKKVAPLSFSQLAALAKQKSQNPAASNVGTGDGANQEIKVIGTRWNC